MATNSCAPTRLRPACTAAPSCGCAGPALIQSPADGVTELHCVAVVLADFQGLAVDGVEGLRVDLRLRCCGQTAWAARQPVIARFGPTREVPVRRPGNGHQRDAADRGDTAVEHGCFFAEVAVLLSAPRASGRRTAGNSTRRWPLVASLATLASAGCGNLDAGQPVAVADVGDQGTGRQSDAQAQRAHRDRSDQLGTAGAV